MIDIESDSRALQIEEHNQSQKELNTGHIAKNEFPFIADLHIVILQIELGSLE